MKSTKIVQKKSLLKVVSPGVQKVGRGMARVQAIPVIEAEK